MTFNSYFIIFRDKNRQMRTMTMNGLQNPEFKNIRESLLKDAEFITHYVEGDSGHLGDVISGIMTTISSLELKAGNLRHMFSEQKSKQAGKTLQLQRLKFLY